MYQTTVIEADHQPINTEHQHITWVENLMQGAFNLLMHPFFPFIKTTSFNFNCLFSRKDFCCPVDHCNSNFNRTNVDSSTTSNIADQLPSYMSLLKDHLNLILGHFNSTSLSKYTTTHKKDLHESHSSYIAIHKRWLPLQLLLCTIALSCYLVHDAKFVAQYLKAGNRNKAERNHQS